MQGTPTWTFGRVIAHGSGSGGVKLYRTTGVSGAETSCCRAAVMQRASAAVPAVPPSAHQRGVVAGWWRSRRRSRATLRRARGRGPARAPPSPRRTPFRGIAADSGVRCTRRTSGARTAGLRNQPHHLSVAVVREGPCPLNVRRAVAGRFAAFGRGNGGHVPQEMNGMAPAGAGSFSSVECALS